MKLHVHMKGSPFISSTSGISFVAWAALIVNLSFGVAAIMTYPTTLGVTSGISWLTSTSQPTCQPTRTGVT